MDFSTLPLNFENWGFYDFLLPYIMFSAIIYAILSRVHVFDRYDESKKEYVKSPSTIVIALISSFFITAYTPAWITLTDYLTNISQNTAYILIGVLMFILLAGLVMGSLDFEFKIEVPDPNNPGKMKEETVKFGEYVRKKFGKLIIVVVILALIYFVFYQFPIFRDQEATNLFWVIASIVALVVIYLLSKK